MTFRGSILLTGALCLPSPATAQADPAPRSTVEGTRVLVGECLFRESSGESAILAPLLTFGIDKALNLVGAALRTAGEDKVTTYYANGNFESAPGALNKTCVIVIRGQFASWIEQADIARLEQAEPAWTTDMHLPKGALVRLAHQHRTLLTAPPEFMAEAVFRSSKDGTAFTLRPLYSAMNAPVSRPALDFSSDRRHVAILISLVTPDQDFASDSNPGAEIVLGELRPGNPQVFRFPQALDNAGYVPWPQESRWFALDANEMTGPVTVRVAVTETRSGSALAKFLGEMFAAVQPTLKAEAEAALIPAKRREAQIAELEQRARLENDYITALQTALTSLNDCAVSGATSTGFADQSTRLALSQKARTDQDAANRAAIGANQRVPFAPAQVVLASTAQSVQGTCRARLDGALKDLGTAVPGTAGAPPPSEAPQGPPPDDNF